ncbi:MAG TPA: alpha/beta hydrolase, partial [Polyangiales bacterium]|nr:alpha/beta hydrolase [Polyangiales bacterium]
MQTRTFWLEVDDGAKLFVHCWEPDAGLPKAAVQIAHGMAEHSARYARVAQRLTSAGYVVYANDHRGHGKTAAKPEDLGFFAAHDGFRRVVRDMVALSERIAQEHASNGTAPALRGGASGLPLFLMGHSMGSLFT